VEVAASTDAKIKAMALVQFVAPNEAALAAGRASVVLNQVFPGCGWLSARHAFGESEYQEALRRRLTEWLSVIHAPAEPIDIMLSGDCNALQAHPRLTRRVLQWPIEPGGCLEEGAIPISDLSVLHDPATGLLDVFDSAHRPLALVYLGTTVPHPAWGPEFWLTTLTSPHRIRCPMEELRPPSDLSIELLPLPRRAVGRVVLRRASWWIRTDRIRRHWYRRRGAGRLVDVAADCRMLGMPRYFFIRPARTATGSASNDQKPLWIDARNPYCLDVLLSVLSQTEWMFIAEALPEAPVWPALSGNCHVSELLVELLL
jgi:hypothetical protein